MPNQPVPVLGHRLIDRQHRRIVSDARTFLAAARRGHGLRELTRLIRSTERNFASETRLMATSRYPRRAGHRSLHDGVLRDMLRLRKRIRRGEALHREHARLTITWLAHHADEADRQLVAHLRDRRPS